MVARRIRDRVRLERSDTYWDHENVKLNIVDALSVDDRTTAFNLYMTGMLDWVRCRRAEVLRELLKEHPKRNDLNPAPQLTTYYYLLNTTRPPLDDKRVRQALSLALDRDEITRVATGAGEIPALSLVPPSMPAITSRRCASLSILRPHVNCLPRRAIRTGRAFRGWKFCITPTSTPGDCRTDPETVAEQSWNHGVASQ